MEFLLIVTHVIVSFLLVVVILLQSGKGGGMGAGLGGAAAAGQQIFGGRGAGTFLSKATVTIAAIFMSTSLILAYISSKPNSAMDLSQTAEQRIETQVDRVIEEGGDTADQEPVEFESLQQLNDNAGSQDEAPSEANDVNAPVDADNAADSESELPSEQEN